LKSTETLDNRSCAHEQIGFQQFRLVEEH